MNNLQLCFVLFIFWALISVSLNSFKQNKLIWVWRNFFLIASLVYLGFIRGGCMCVVGYVQGAVLFVMGNDFMLTSFLLVVMFLVMTLFFGKVWCGWLCPLGALQEMLYLGNSSKIRTTKLFLFFKKPAAHWIMRIMQILSFIALVVLVAVKEMMVFCPIDPFKAIFRLHVEGPLMWTLVSVLIVSSLLIYRPFCQAFCPMGLLMNLVQLIPGARRIRVDHQGCVHCKRCEKRCRMDAIKDAKIHNTCIACGDCLGLHCKFLKGDEGRVKEEN